MENQNQESMSQEQMLKEIYEFTRKTHKYLQWQIYITIVMVVLPILAMAFILPSVLSGLSASYSSVLK
jgi:uncharacterized protein involved in cysteine biosynthesis